MIDFQLMEHQRQIIWKSQFEKNLFLAWEMGVGKTCATIQILRQRYQEAGRLRKTLVICPVIVQQNWKKEFGLYSKVPERAIHVLTGPVKQRIEFIRQCTWNAVLIINYDVFENKELVAALAEWGPEILVCDEAHLLKSYKSKRARNIAALAKMCEHRYLLTGTPILNSAMDLFMPYLILDGGETFGQNFFAFRNLYFEDANARWAGKPNYFPKWQPRASTFELLGKKISKTMIQVNKHDVLDLPPLVVEDIEVEMNDDQKKVYKDLKRDFLAFIESHKGEKKAVVAKLAITKALRLQQVTTGHVKLEDGTIYKFKNNPRGELLKQLLQNITPNHKVIVWAVFKENYEQIREICDEIGVGYTELHGDVPSGDKFHNVEAFNTDPKCRVCIGHPASAGVGVSLIGATYSIYFSRTYRAVDDVQSEARNYRRGSEIHDKITRINLVCPGTIDEHIAKAIANKKDLAETILDIANEI